MDIILITICLNPLPQDIRQIHQPVYCTYVHIDEPYALDNEGGSEHSRSLSRELLTSYIDLTQSLPAE